MFNETVRLLLVAYVLCVSAPALADSAMQDAYKALRLLNAATEAGVSYTTFREEWAKTNGAVNIALEDTKPGPATKQLQVTKEAYGDLSILWSCQVQGHYVQTALSSCFDQDFKDRNPVVLRALQKGLVEEPLDNKYYLKAMVSYLMTTASMEVKTFGEILKGGGQSSVKKLPREGPSSSDTPNIEPSPSPVELAPRGPALVANGVEASSALNSVADSPEDPVDFFCRSMGTAAIAYYSEGQTMESVLLKYESALADHSLQEGFEIDAATIAMLKIQLESSILGAGTPLIEILKSPPPGFIDRFVPKCREGAHNGVK